MEYQLKTPISGANEVNVFTDSPLGKGATATVYRSSINGASYAAKIFHDKSKLDLKKIEAMLANPPSNLTGVTAGIEYPRYSWPISIVQDSFGQAVGYVMPLIDQKESFTLDHYYDKNLGKKLNSPDEVALSYKIEIAANLSRLIADLHSHRHCFVDCKPQNIRVFKRTHAVTLLDCDGFSINDNNGKRFPAELLSTDYISPEAFREQKGAKDLGEYHDRYALATIIFQLLNSGIHPFQGISTGQVTAATNDEKAAQGLYPHGLVSDPRIKPRPQSVHNCFDDSTRELFDKAFMGLPKYRPSAAEWATHLDGLLQNKQLTRCDQHPYDIRHMRFMGKPCPECQLTNIQVLKSNQNKTSINLPPISSPIYSSPIQASPGAPMDSGVRAMLIGFGLVGIVLLSLSFYSSAPTKPKTKTTVSYTQQEMGPYVQEINAIHNESDLKIITYKTGGQSSWKADKLIGVAWGIIKYRDSAYYGLAYKLNKEAYELGHPEAASNIGYMYEYGLGVNQSYEEARWWYQKAISMGQPHSTHAEFQLGKIYQYGKNGITDLAKAKQLYETGLVLPRWGWDDLDDRKEIEANLKKLSHSENKEASAPKVNISNSSNNLSKPNNAPTIIIPSTMVTYTAQEMGKYESQINSIRSSPDSKTDTYTPGATLVWRAGQLVSIGWKIIQAKEADYYKLGFKVNNEAYELGHPEGASNMGFMYEYGMGVPQSYENAASWYQRAINMGKHHSAQAEIHLGQMYQYGKLGTPDLNKARQLYGEAIIQAEHSSWSSSKTKFLRIIQENLYKISQSTAVDH